MVLNGICVFLVPFLIVIHPLPTVKSLKMVNKPFYSQEDSQATQQLVPIKLTVIPHRKGYSKYILTELGLLRTTALETSTNNSP